MTLARLCQWLRPTHATNRRPLRLMTLEERAVPAIFAVASGASATLDTTVKVYDDNGVFKTQFKPFTTDPAHTIFFRGGATVAVGDVDHDGLPDVICGPGQGGGPDVKVFSGVDIAANSTNPSVIYEVFPFPSGFTGGVNVAAGDVNGDGFADVVAGAGPTGSPHVKVQSGAPGHDTLMSFYAYESTFRGGVNVAAGDIGGDITTDEVVTGAGPGGGPKVGVYNFVANANPELTQQKIAEFFAYATTFRGGAYVSSAMVSNNRDASNFGYSDIITGAGPGGGPDVKVFRLLDAQYDAAGNPANWTYFQAGDVFPYYSAFTGGVRVGAVPHGSSGLDDILTTPGVNGGPDVRIYNQTTIGDLVTYVPGQRTAFYAFDAAFLGGVFVG